GSYPNAAGIELRQASRGSGTYGPHLPKDVAITNNTVWQCPAFPPPPTPWSGVATKDFSVFDASRNNVWDGNSYSAPARIATPFRWWAYNHSGVKATRYLDWSAWQGAGQDVHGS